MRSVLGTVKTFPDIKKWIVFVALTKCVSDWFSITEGTSWSKPVHIQEVIKKQSLSVLFFQQFLLPLSKHKNSRQ